MGAGPTPSSSTPTFRPIAVTTTAPVLDASGGVSAVDSSSVVGTGSLVVAPPAPATLACAMPASATPAAARPTVQVRPQVAATTTTRPLAAFLGDSYTTGYNGAGLGRVGWPAIVSASLRWRPQIHAVAGTGFVNPGWTAQPIRARVTGVIRAKPGIVVLAGGHNDRKYATSRTAKAADAVIDRLRAGLPNSILVVIGPIWADGSPPSSLRVLRDHLRRKAASIGAIFIDPLRGGWFAGQAHRLIGPDGIHPTNAGHRHIAALVLRALRADRRFAAIAAPRAPSEQSVAAPAAEAGAGTLQDSPCPP